MDPVSRRTFLTGTTAAFAAAGVVSVLPGGAASAALKLRSRQPASHKSSLETGKTPLKSELKPKDSVIAHIRDISTGEIEILYGTDQIVLHDPLIASRLRAAALGGN